MRTLFVTGTDTGVGKTYVSCLLLKALSQAGVRALPFKPVAAGAVQGGDGHWYNEDGQALQQACAEPLAYELINPVTLPDPLSPHLAAARVGRTVTTAELLTAVEAFHPWRPELLLVEGAGGWRVPLNEHETLADLAKDLLADEGAGGVVLVVGMRLGCLNHALLTAEAIRADGLPLLGWVANCIDPEMNALADNIATLEARLGAPRLATLAYGATAADFDLRPLLGAAIISPEIGKP